MKRRAAIWFTILTWPALFTLGRAQANSRPVQTTEQSALPLAENVDKNLQEYIELLGSDIRQTKPR